MVNDQQTTGHGYYLQRTGIVEVNLVLDVEIGSPVANFSRTLKRRDLENGVTVVVVHRDGLLVLGEELCARRGTHIVVRSVGDGSSRLGHGTISNEFVYPLRSRIRRNIRGRGPVQVCNSARREHDNSNTPDFGTLNESDIRAVNEQVRVIFQELRVCLRSVCRVGMCCVRLDRLENKTDRPIDSELLRQCHGKYMNITWNELASTPQGRVSTHRMSRSPRSTMSSGRIWPLTLASIQLVFSFSSLPRAMWYTA